MTSLDSLFKNDIALMVYVNFFKTISQIKIIKIGFVNN